MAASSSWLRKWTSQDRGRRPAVVLGMSVTGLSYLRSLHRRGVPTLLLAQHDRIGSPSRFECTLDLPDVVEEPDVWLETLVAAAERSARRPVLLVSFDQALLFAGRNAEELSRLYD